MINTCSECFDSQREIYLLNEEVKRLKAKLRTQERKQEEGVFGSSTPSSKVPIKANTPVVEKEEIRRQTRPPGKREEKVYSG